MNANILLNYGDLAGAIMIYEEKRRVLLCAWRRGFGPGLWTLDLRADPWPAHRIETQHSSQPLLSHGHGPL